MGMKETKAAGREGGVGWEEARSGSVLVPFVVRSTTKFRSGLAEREMTLGWFRQPPVISLTDVNPVEGNPPSSAAGWEVPLVSKGFLKSPESQKASRVCT